MFKKFVFLLLLVSVNSNYVFGKVKIIYGIDNRIETYEASEKFKKLASSSAGMFTNVDAINLDEHIMLRPGTLRRAMNLCPSERFSRQNIGYNVVCSGFLVGRNLLVTAGHCVTSMKDCKGSSWVFDYKVNKHTKQADILVKKSNVYKCSKILERKLTFTNKGKPVNDYALVKLDRVVSGRTPLKYRVKSKAATNTKLTVIGHPTGLPQKIASGAKVLDNSNPIYFKTNLDTFGGNSGSGVFNSDTGIIEGILVRGQQDYDQGEKDKCVRVFKAPKEYQNIKEYGEDVTRITEIKSLKYSVPFFRAVMQENFSLIKRFINEGLNPNITDESAQTALHVSTSKRSTRLVEFFIKALVSLDEKNILGETALHIAVKNNDLKMVKLLIDAGAKLGIKDNNGNTALDIATKFPKISKTLQLYVKTFYNESKK